MYNFRYYAIGHSYLKHGPFPGWQTEGFWGMAASAPEFDYFHQIQEGLKSAFDCSVEALAENQAVYERLCTEDATEEKYTSSAEYAHIRDVLEGFKPNIITLVIGGGNTPAKDDASLTLFFEVLYALVAKYKLPEAVVICATIRPNLVRISNPIAEKYGFISTDVSFLHENRGRDNPYYAFAEYPEYDEKLALGAVEFRTHPNNKGHLAIAESILAAAKSALADIPEGEFLNYELEKFIRSDIPAKFRIKTEPGMSVSYFGFNVRQNGDTVTFGSAPGTGASLAAGGFEYSKEWSAFSTELAVEGASERDLLTLVLSGESGTAEYSLPIVNGMHKYTFKTDIPCGHIDSLRLYTSSEECVLTVKSPTAITK